MSIVIIVDDEPGNYYLVEKAIHETTGSIIFHAENSRSFFKLIKRVVPDFIFLKVMPGSDSMHSLKKLRSIHKYNGVPVIMYSTGGEYEMEAYKNGADHYISRPDFYNKAREAIFFPLSQMPLRH